MVRASTLLAPSQELAARAQPMSRPFSFLLFFSFDFAFSANVSCLLPHSYHAGSGRPLSAKPRVSFSRNSSRSKLLPPADVERSTSGASLHADHQGALIIRRKFLDALSGQFVCHVEGLPGRFRSSSLYGVAFRSLPLATTPLYLKSRSGVGKPVDSRFSVGAPLQDRYY